MFEEKNEGFMLRDSVRAGQDMLSFWQGITDLMAALGTSFFEMRCASIRNSFKRKDQNLV